MPNNLIYYFDDIFEYLDELRGLLFIHECAELYQLDELPNLRHHASTYDENTMQLLRQSVISLYHQKLFDLTRNLETLHVLLGAEPRSDEPTD